MAAEITKDTEEEVGIKIDFDYWNFQRAVIADELNRFDFFERLDKLKGL